MKRDIGALLKEELSKIDDGAVKKIKVEKTDWTEVKVSPKVELKQKKKDIETLLNEELSKIDKGAFKKVKVEKSELTDVKLPPKVKLKQKKESSCEDVFGIVKGDLKPLINGLVADYLSKTCPRIAEEFKNEHFLRYSNGYTLEQVVKSYPHKVKAASKAKVGRKKKVTSVREKRIPFSTEEDEVILERCQNGDSYSQIGKELGRHQVTIRDRYKKLVSSGATKTKIPFTVEEDFIVIDSVVEELLNGTSLRNVVLTPSSKATELLKRHYISASKRWETNLKVWLLSYYHKTLNADIRPCLSNYIADNFSSYQEIDWQEVLNHREFIGHTERSLKHAYSNLERNFCRNKCISMQEVTLQQIAEYANSKQLQSRPRKDLEKRQMQVIDYLIDCLKKHNIDIRDLDLS